MNQYVSYRVCFRYKLKLIMKNHSLIESLIIGVEKFSRIYESLYELSVDIIRSEGSANGQTKVENAV